MNQNLIYYRNSIKHFIDLSAKDATASIAKEHGIVGLTRITICMEKLGLDTSHNYFIALPDYTYTRSALRWNAGFPYGCIISIDQSIPFIPIDFRPNCCGIIFAKVPTQEFDIGRIKKNILNLCIHMMILIHLILIDVIIFLDFIIVKKRIHITF